LFEDFPQEEETVPRGEASSLMINPRLTGGLDMNGQPGDEGVMVVVEPRDAQGKLVRSEGKLSLMVVDPQQEGVQGRIARWDFTPEETDAAWRKSLLGQGLHFELPWPNQPPQVDRLRLYVRLVTSSGQKILAETDFDVDKYDANSLEEVKPLLGNQPRDGFTARAPNNSWSRSERARQVIPKRTERESIQIETWPLGTADRPSRDKISQSEERDSDRARDTGRDTGSQLKEARNRRPIWKPFR
jgi:hypothetical protein